MLASSIPVKFPIPFANNAGGSYTHQVPTASQIGVTSGAASLHDGFVPLNFTPVAGGGVPPIGADFNGILNQMSAWDQWFSIGGPITYDATQQTAIGGYPKGSVVQSATTAGKFWQSTADSNTTNPDTGGANWVQPYVTSVNGSTGAVTIATGGGVTSVNGSTGIVTFTYVASFNGSHGVVTYTPPVTSVNGQTGAVALTVVSTFNGASGAVTYTPPVTSVNGATGAITLGNLGFTDLAHIASTGSYTLPNGLIVKWGVQSATVGNNTIHAVNFANAFPNACFAAFAQPVNPGGVSSVPYSMQVNGVSSLTAAAVTFISVGFTASSTCPDFIWFAIGN